MALLPKPYQVGQDISRLEHLRPAFQSLGIALSKASRAEGGPPDPYTSDPRGNPSIIKRLNFRTQPPKIKLAAPTIKPLKLAGTKL
jgi:hypothetical protein